MLCAFNQSRRSVIKDATFAVLDHLLELRAIIRFLTEYNSFFNKSRPHSQIVQFWLADCRSTMWAYKPFRAYSSAGLPCSATMPPDSTTT